MQSVLIPHGGREAGRCTLVITQAKGHYQEGKEHRMSKCVRGNLKTPPVYRINSFLSLHSLRTHYESCIFIRLQHGQAVLLFMIYIFGALCLGKLNLNFKNICF